MAPSRFIKNTPTTTCYLRSPAGRDHDVCRQPLLPAGGIVSAAQEFTLFSWWDVNLAADFQYNTLEADLVNFVYPSRFTSLTALATSLRFGKIDVQGSLLYTFVDDFAREAGAAAESKHVLTPTVVAQYLRSTTSTLSLRAFYKRVFRMPTLNDLYYVYR